jgi:hypothetical protein
MNSSPRQSLIVRPASGKRDGRRIGTDAGAKDIRSPLYLKESVARVRLHDSTKRGGAAGRWLRPSRGRSIGRPVVQERLAEFQDCETLASALVQYSTRTRDGLAGAPE